MGLNVSTKTADNLPSSIKAALAKMPEEQQALFEDEFNRKSRSKVTMLLLAIFFPIQLFLLNKTALGVLFIITCAGLGFWWIAELFLTPGRVRDYNGEVATRMLTDMKIMNS